MLLLEARQQALEPLLLALESRRNDDVAERAEDRYRSRVLHHQRGDRDGVDGPWRRVCLKAT